jgi:NTE family protein
MLVPGGAVIRVGLVLGAGGVVGQAYHAGVLAALEQDIGWDPRGADVIVGSSAGSVTGTLLRLGVSASDLASHAVDSPLSADGASILNRLAVSAPFPRIDVRGLLRPWRWPTPELLARVGRRPWAFRPDVAVMTLLPAGRVDLMERADRLTDLVGGEWPEGLWICAVRRGDGGRTVFGRAGAPPSPLASAVAASCAIPGYFAPVDIDGVEYLDGGVHSPTNAATLRHLGLDLVIVISPMSAVRGQAPWPGRLMRRSAHRRLDAEVRALRTEGISVVRFEPGPRSLEVMGLNAMATDRSDRVVQAAFFESGSYAATNRIRGRLQVLAGR